MKFGGTSLEGAERILGAARIVRERMGDRPFVVVSALAGVTDLLDRALALALDGDQERLDSILADLERRHRWALAGCIEDAGRRHPLGLEIDGLFEELRGRLRSIRILREQTPRSRDSVLSFGENLSARIVTAAFRDCGIPAHRLDPQQVVATNGNHGHAEPDSARVERLCREHLRPVMDAGEVPVLGGFVGAGPDGVTTTLGRGGSDTSAAILGLALRVKEIQIWTDVDGLMTADPRRVPDARTLTRVSFSEAAELAYYGARVLHPDAVAPAVRAAIPVRVMNSLNPDSSGTLIVEEVADDGTRPVALASRDDVSLIRATSRCMRRDARFLPRILEACASAGVIPAFVLASDLAVSIVAPGTVEAGALQSLVGENTQIQVQADRAIVCVVGARLAHSGTARAEVLEAIAAWEPEMVALGASSAALAAVVSRERLQATLCDLHRRFIERDRE